MHAITDSRLTQLAFPLNVFACASLLQEGQVDYLHYGLFDAGHPDMRSAQRRSTELILARLPACGARILEVGIGVGTTARLLGARGYRLTGISPDPAQVAIARDRVGDAARLEAVRFEDYSADAETLDVILLQESFQYLDPEHFFAEARRLLVPGGQILILDQCRLRSTSPSESTLHLIEDVLAQAGLEGFLLSERLDLTQDATPTLDYILTILDAHRERLLAELPIAADDLDQLREAVAANRRRYHQGVLGYVLYRFTR